MKILAIILALATVGTALADDVSHCNPEKSKPCGRGCIRRSFTCHKPTPTDGTAAQVAKSGKVK